MSYTIDVVAEEPSRLDWPALEGALDERRLRVVEAEEVDLAEPWPPDLYVHAYLDGVSTRTVELNRTDTGLSVRVMTASCHEDVWLALALARAALDRGGGTAGGEDGLDLDALDDDWVSGYVDSGVLAVCAMAAREEQPLRIPGPLRTTSIGRRVIDELSAMPEEERCIDQRLASLLLTALGYNLQMGAFLPTLEEAVEDNDRQGMNLLARHLLAEYRDEQKAETLGAVWEATMAVLAPGEVEDDQKKEALKRAVEYADDVRDAKGESWLRETFTDRPDRGMEVLATIGAETSLGMVQRSSRPADRLADLELMRSAVDALLEIAPERAGEWQGTLTLLADTWLREAAYSYKNSTQTSMGPMAERDPFGNIYWVDYGYRYNRYRTPVQPVEPDALLDNRPDGPWRAALPDSLRPKIDQTIAELYLKVQEEALAFPYIKELAPANPKKANELAETFINGFVRQLSLQTCEFEL